jgi:hypothetical protein
MGLLTEMPLQTDDKKEVILLEHEEQVRNYLTSQKGIKGKKIIVALSPFAMYELEKQGVPYRIIDDYYDEDELYKLGIENYKKVEALCNKIDERIHSTCPIFKELKIRPAFFSYYQLKIIYDTVTIRLFQLSKLIKTEEPGRLYIYETKRYPFGTSEMAPGLLFDNRESIYAHLLTCKKWNIPVVKLPFVPYPKDFGMITKSPENRLMRWLQNYPRLFDLAAETKKHGFSVFFRRFKSLFYTNKDKVLLFGSGYNWDDCREELASVGIDPIFIRFWDNLETWIEIANKFDTDNLPNVWKELKSDKEFLKLFVKNNVDFLPVLEERIRFLIECISLACISAYEKTVEAVKKRGIKAFLASNFASPTSRSAAQAARNFNIPVVSWQHGNYGYMDQPMVIYYDMTCPDFHFVFGEGVAVKYESSAKRFGAQLIPVGSPSLELLNKKRTSKKVEKLLSLPRKEKVILYVSTNFYQNNLYISFPPPFSDNQLWRTQKGILDVLAKHHNYSIIVKMHPNPIYRESPMRMYAKERGFSNCRFIIDECSFTDLIPFADLLIIDFPSTTLLEALTTSKPIFVYTGHLRLDQKALEMLERRAFCYGKLEKMLDDLSKYLFRAKTSKSVRLTDKKFLKAYGISTHGIGSGMRAAKMLKKIIMEKSK